MIGNFGANLDVGGKLDLSGAVDLAADVSAAANVALQVGANAALDLSAGFGFSAPSPAAPVGTHPPDPWPLFKFIVQIQGINTPLRFQKCGPIGVDSAPDNTHKGGSPTPGIMLPSLRWTWKPVSLSRGMAKDGVALWQWVMDTVSTRPIKLRDITVILLDDEGKPGMTWTFVKTYPTSWSIVALDASSNNGLAIETITFAHQGASVVFAGGSYQNTGTPPPTPPTPPSPAPGGGNKGGSGNGSKADGGNASNSGGGGASKSGGASGAGGGSGKSGGGGASNPAGGGASNAESAASNSGGGASNPAVGNSSDTGAGDGLGASNP